MPPEPHRKAIQAPRRQGLARLEHEVVVVPAAGRVQLDDKPPPHGYHDTGAAGAAEAVADQVQAARIGP